VTGAVDAFQWKAPVDAIGRGDQTLVIEEHVETPREAPPPVVAIPKPRPPETVEPLEAAPEPTVRDGAGKPAPAPAPAAPAPAARREAPPPRAVPEVFIQPHAPDDPGVAQADPDESPASLERLRAAQIR
jgi:uncharacterized membrane-anchored protein